MFSLIKGKKDDDMKLLVDAVENYFYVWANVGKKPGWCERTEKAKTELRRLMRKHGKEII